MKRITVLELSALTDEDFLSGKMNLRIREASAAWLSEESADGVSAAAVRPRRKLKPINSGFFACFLM